MMQSNSCEGDDRSCEENIELADSRSSRDNRAFEISLENLNEIDREEDSYITIEIDTAKKNNEYSDSQQTITHASHQTETNEQSTNKDINEQNTSSVNYEQSTSSVNNEQNTSSVNNEQSTSSVNNEQSTSTVIVINDTSNDNVINQQSTSVETNLSDEHCKHSSDIDIECTCNCHLKTLTIDPHMRSNFGTSPSTKSLPTYSSLVDSIIKDEPPKYEVVTGHKLSSSIDHRHDENVTSPYKRRLAGVVVFLAVIAVVALLVYLAITNEGETGKSNKSSSIATTRRTNFVGLPK